MQAVRTSLVAVTIMAIVLGVIATVNMHYRDDRSAKPDLTQAIKDAQDARARLEAITRQLDLIDVQVAAAVRAVIDAESDAERARAKVRLIELQKQQYELKRKVDSYMRYTRCLIVLPA